MAEKIHFTSIDSTNAEVARRFKAETREKEIIITAEYQTIGRGRSTNRWYSDAAKNLLMSWGCHPEFLSVSDQFKLSKAVSLALCGLLDDNNIVSSIKWPNDIYVSGKKIAGILIENQLMGGSIRSSIIGIGLNVNQVEFPPEAGFPVSMKLLTGRDMEVPSLADGLLVKMRAAVDALKSDLFSLDGAYHSRLYKLGEECLFSVNGNEFSGKIRGVDDSGQLVLESATGIRSYGFHEISMIIS